MQIVRDWRRTPPNARGAVVALGNFDGVHRGHAHVLDMARRARPDAPRAVLTFEPHPRELFRPDDPPFRLTLAAERADALAALGVDWLFELPFDRSFSEHTADAFIGAVLHEEVGAAHLACGWDFAFGHRRGGDARVLALGAASRGIGLTVVPPLQDAEGPESQGPISSTRIRRLLQDGYPERAAAALGRPWSIRGTVAHGDARGRTIGVPTANVALGRHLEPARGVYAVRVRLPDGTEHDGVANIGVRPTVGGTQSRVEAHVFDWSGDLYGQEIAVALHAYLRAEQKFDSFAALTGQIAADSARARDILRGDA